MSTGTAVLIAVVVLVVVLAILAACGTGARRCSGGSGRSTTGQERDGRLRAERDLAQRERLRDKLGISVVGGEPTPLRGGVPMSGLSASPSPRIQV